MDRWNLKPRRWLGHSITLPIGEMFVVRSLIQKNQISLEIIWKRRVQPYLNDIINDGIINGPQRWEQLQYSCVYQGISSQWIWDGRSADLLMFIISSLADAWWCISRSNCLKSPLLYLYVTASRDGLSQGGIGMISMFKHIRPRSIVDYGDERF